MRLSEWLLFLSQRAVVLLTVGNAGTFLYCLGHMMFSKPQGGGNASYWGLPDELGYLLATLVIAFPLTAMAALLRGKDPESSSTTLAMYVSLIMSAGLLLVLFAGLCLKLSLRPG